MTDLIRRSRTDTFDHTISGLLTKRADLCGEIERLRERLEAAEGDIASVDRVLRLVGYAGTLDALPAPKVKDAPYARGEVMRTVLDVLRSATRPLAAREVARQAYSERFREDDSPAIQESYTRRVSKALQRLKREGVVSGVATAAGVVRWELGEQ